MNDQRRRGVYAGRGGRTGLTRVERTTAARRERAQEHLNRVRREGPAPHRTQLWGVAAALAAIGVGGALGSSWVGVGAALSESGGRLDAIYVRGASQLSGQEVAEATGLAPGAAWTSVDPAAAALHLSSHPWITSARAVRATPTTLVIRIEERVPRAVTADADGRLLFVDASGTAFAPAVGERANSLPRLVPVGAVVRDQADHALAEAVDLSQRVLAHGLALPAEVALAADGDPEGYVLRLAGRSARVVLGRDDLDARLARLAQLLASNVSEIVAAATVDLRFADQAVLRETRSPTGEAQAAAKRRDATPSNRRPSG